MNLALWIGIPVLLILVAVWRLRRAARTLRRILDEEQDHTDPLPVRTRDGPPPRTGRVP